MVTKMRDIFKLEQVSNVIKIHISQSLSPIYMAVYGHKLIGSTGPSSPTAGYGFCSHRVMLVQCCNYLWLLYNPYIWQTVCSHISVIIHCLIYTTTRTKILDMVMPLHCLQAQGWHPHFGSGNGLGVIWFCISLQSNGCLSVKDKTQHNIISFILA